MKLQGTEISRIVLATGNPGKVREIGRLLEGFHCEVLPQSSFEVTDAEETGLSFVENAILKARHAASWTGLPAIADDSGLVVDALKGAPGIYSARYAGKGASDQDNVEKLLTELGDRPENERSARFICSMVFLRHENDPVPIVCQGIWEGRVLYAPRGEGGFGYDPVFHVPTHDCSAAELPPDEKNRISHRGQALQQLLARLTQLQQR